MEITIKLERSEVEKAVIAYALSESALDQRSAKTSIVFATYSHEATVTVTPIEPPSPVAPPNAPDPDQIVLPDLTPRKSDF